MLKNRFSTLLLLLLATFIMIKCTALQPVDRSGNKDGTPSTTISESNSERQLRQDIADYAMRFVGSKYKYAGRTPSGFDCSGFTHYVMKEFNIDLSGPSRSQEHFGKSVPTSRVKTGDLLFFRRTKNGDVFHVALVVSNDSDGIKAVHSTSSRGVVIDNITASSYWAPKLSTARDIISN